MHVNHPPALNIALGIREYFYDESLSAICHRWFWEITRFPLSNFPHNSTIDFCRRRPKQDYRPSGCEQSSMDGMVMMRIPSITKLEIVHSNNIAALDLLDDLKESIIPREFIVVSQFGATAIKEI
ncbi:hypothetical protein PILCRDRAFT_93279 [Piloderma croceum F 1598]|uniref:Uncharacterized protein n=1 Tax=Piloderma croceum (strain F 1598) TaxID=765440 RepID=A0A0C3EYU4_PILCF|nr:hypothetical protein PILCRDRAFT_93279 [Piloderma croceum F 1598]